MYNSYNPNVFIVSIDHKTSRLCVAKYFVVVVIGGGGGGVIADSVVIMCIYISVTIDIC
jgi:hypothetical protein